MEPDAMAIEDVELFWCISCHNAILENDENCHEIDRAQVVGPLARIYRIGWCRDCWRKFHAIDGDDQLALHDALATLTSLSDIERESVVPMRGWKAKATA